MTDHTGMFLVDTRQITRKVFERYNRNIEAVAETDKTGCLIRRIAIEHTGHHHRLVGDKSDRLTSNTPESDNDIRSEHLHYFEEFALVDQRLDHIAHIIGYGRIARDDFCDVVFRKRHCRSNLLRFGRIVHRDH